MQELVQYRFVVGENWTFTRRLPSRPVVGQVLEASGQPRYRVVEVGAELARCEDLKGAS